MICELEVAAGKIGLRHVATHALVLPDLAGLDALRGTRVVTALAFSIVLAGRRVEALMRIVARDATDTFIETGRVVALACS